MATITSTLPNVLMGLFSMPSDILAAICDHDLCSKVSDASRHAWMITHSINGLTVSDSVCFAGLSRRLR